MRQKKFLLSSNLFPLAKWLRFLGYDAVFPKAVSFSKKAAIAKKEGRVILTSSKAEAKRAKETIYIKAQKTKDQLAELISYSKSIHMNKNRLFTVCPLCNRLLNPIEKKRVESLVPEVIFQSKEQFKICRRCGRVFWRGSQTKEIEETLKEIFKK